MGRKVTFSLGGDDISAIRFGISPGHEMSHAVRALLDPGAHPLQWGWLRAVQPRLSREAVGTLALVIGVDGYFPDFLTCSPSWEMTPEEEVERLRTVSLEQVRFDLTKVLARSSGRRHERVAAMLAAPAEARERIAEAWSAVWEVALAPYWEQSRRLMTADIALRTQQLAARGLGEVVATLADGVHWRGDAIEVDMRFHSEVVDCAGSGVVLVPSVMSRRCSVLTEKHVQATLFYPVRGVSESWTEPRAPRREALARLLGAGRAEVLLSLDAPRSTSEVAAACGLGAPTASHHLAVLRDARLVDSSRDGGRVLHARTPLGDTLAG